MFKRIASALTALLVAACALPALAADPTPARAPLRVLATRTVRAGRHSLGLLFFLVGAAVVVWLVLRWRAGRMGYPHYPGHYAPGGAQPRPYGPAGYSGGYVPGGLGIMGSVASGLAGAPPPESPPASDPKSDDSGSPGDPDSRGHGDG